MSRDCEHGNLARKCPICELIAAEARIAELGSKLVEALKERDARVDELSEQDGKIDALEARLDSYKAGHELTVAQIADLDERLASVHAANEKHMLRAIEAESRLDSARVAIAKQLAVCDCTACASFLRSTLEAIDSAVERHDPIANGLPEPERCLGHIDATTQCMRLAGHDGICSSTGESK